MLAGYLTIFLLASVTDDSNVDCSLVSGLARLGQDKMVNDLRMMYCMLCSSHERFINKDSLETTPRKSIN